MSFDGMVLQAVALGLSFSATAILAQAAETVPGLGRLAEYSILGALVAWHTYTGWQREKATMERMRALEDLIPQLMLKADAVKEMTDQIAKAAESHRLSAELLASAVSKCASERK